MSVDWATRMQAIINRNPGWVWERPDGDLYADHIVTGVEGVPGGVVRRFRLYELCIELEAHERQQAASR